MHVRLVVAALAVLAVAPATARANTIITFKELNKGSTFQFIDHAPKAKNARNPSISMGDQFVFVNPLANDKGEHAGRLRATCTFTENASSFAKGPATICYGVFSFFNGSIDAMVAISNLNAKTTNGGIVGGTGAYAGAHGTLKSVSTKSGSSDTITLLG